jgi:replicative DNA helicase
LINAAAEITEKAYYPDGFDTASLIDFAEKLVFDISDSDRRQSGAFQPIQGLLTQAVDRIEELYESKQAITGVASGFKDLDNLTSGFQPADLIVVAGRPSMGKTSLAMNIAENAAVGSKLPVAVFSMEMPGQQLAMRMLASLGRINAHRVRTGQLSQEDWPRLTSAVGLLDELPIFIDDTPALTPLELRTRIRRLTREHGQLGVVIVDYLQLMQTGQSTENRAVEVANITRALKIIAREARVPVVVLSQLNRGLEQRPNKRPIMSDLRESGAIEQDADLILFIYRDEVYNEDSPEKGTAEIIVAKQRNGPIGTVRLTFLGEYTRFENYTPAFENSGY